MPYTVPSSQDNLSRKFFIPNQLLTSSPSRRILSQPEIRRGMYEPATSQC